MDVIFVMNHQHIGGYNLTLEHFRDGQNEGILCSSEPTYGNGSVAGNENGYGLCEGSVMHFFFMYNDF